jgi:ABC-type multidrug transport system ATPase subunit
VLAALLYAESPADKARIEEILETVRLTARKDELAADLSHGQKQWLEIGMLLAQDPKLLLVDEPVAGMTDAETVETAIAPQGQIARTRSVVVVEHDMSFVRELGTRVTCLAEGSVLAEGIARPGERQSDRHRAVSRSMMPFQTDSDPAPSHCLPLLKGEGEGIGATWRRCRRRDAGCGTSPFMGEDGREAVCHATTGRAEADPPIRSSIPSPSNDRQ